MRVREAGSQGRADAPQAERFGDALRRAREGDVAAPRGRADASATRTEARRTAAARAGAGGFLLREPPRDVERAGQLAADLPRPGGSPEVQAVPEIAALARTLPLAVAAAGAREGAPLALSFGRSLDVELRSGAAGVEILLRPEPRLLHAAEAELPRVVAAMRARGIAVARAEVQARGATRRAR